MKKILAKIVKLIFVFIVSSLIIYFTFTLITFVKWCKINNIPLFINQKNIQKYILNELDSNYIENLGKSVIEIKEGMENSLDKKNYDGSENYSSIAEMYDSMGYAIWFQNAIEINNISIQHIPISVILGVVADLLYLLITNKDISYTNKFLIGYLSIILLFPPIYLYSWTYRIWSFKDTYLSYDAKRFYIVYFIVFFIVFIINYKINKNITNNLNKEIKK